ncbi:MAG: CADD family putative folate metabolism protein [Actinomycetota bacterium]
MSLLDDVDRLIDERHLLTHSFYTKWVAGELPNEAIQEYAKQYFAFEASFPRFLSAIHSRTEDPAVRQGILENLWDEEHGEENHRELWLRFAEGVGVDRSDVMSARLNEATEALVETYRDAAEDPVAGLAAIHAYERQVPAVAEAKINGLAEHYGIDDERTVAFWKVHRSLDVEHAETERGALEEASSEAVLEGTRRALDAWWTFLDAVDVPAEPGSVS